MTLREQASERLTPALINDWIYEPGSFQDQAVEMQQHILDALQPLFDQVARERETEEYKRDLVIRHNHELLAQLTVSREAIDVALEQAADLRAKLTQAEAKIAHVEAWCHRWATRKNEPMDAWCFAADEVRAALDRG